MFHREFRDHGSHHRARFITSLGSHSVRKRFPYVTFADIKNDSGLFG